MRYLKLLAALGVLGVGLAAAPAANAQVAVGVAVGPSYVGGPPVCPYGYYPYSPYACAPYGYYGPSWFVGGVFIGAGPWYGWGHGWHGHGWYGHGWNGRGWNGHGPVVGHNGFVGRGPVARGPVAMQRGGAGFHGNSFAGARGDGFHGGGRFHGGGGTRGGGHR